MGIDLEACCDDVILDFWHSFSAQQTGSLYRNDDYLRFVARQIVAKFRQKMTVFLYEISTQAELEAAPTMIPVKLREHPDWPPPDGVPPAQAGLRLVRVAEDVLRQIRRVSIT